MPFHTFSCLVRQIRPQIMALCELKSDESKAEPGQIPNEDLEDGEIEDDEEEAPPETAAPASAPPEPRPQPATPTRAPPEGPRLEQRHEKPHDRPAKFEPRRRHSDSGKKKQPLTEAEKSVMFLHQLERMERDKREKYRREPVDDFASSIEKQIASVLKKDRTVSDEDKDEDKRGKKRKKRDRDRRRKRKPDVFEPDDGGDAAPNQHGDLYHHPQQQQQQQQHHQMSKDGSPRSDESYSDESDGISSDRSAGEERRDRRRERHDRRARNRDRNRDRRNDNRDKKLLGQQQQQQQQPQQQQQNQYGQQQQQQQYYGPPDVQMKDSQQLCVYYLQGKCQKGEDCPYSHESQPPMKWELCKFYLNDCCAKGDKCLYMHSDFPCKFYHTGQQCLEGENCKFAHGKPLSDRLKQILFKHIETAPKDILGRFPRMSREEAIFKINQTQKGLEVHYGAPRGDDEGIPSLFDISVGMPGGNDAMQADGKKDKGGGGDKPRNRPSRWQDPEPLDKQQGFPDQQHKGPANNNFGPKGGFHHGLDLDMRIQNNGDVDMRTLQLSMTPQGPPNLMLPPPNMLGSPSLLPPQNMSIPPPNIMMMNPPPTAVADVDRPPTINFRPCDDPIKPADSSAADDDYEPKLEIVMDEEPSEKAPAEIPANLPKKQRELFMRIQAQQKQNLLEDQRDQQSDNEDNNVDWYSDDSNEGKLTIKCDDDFKEKEPSERHQQEEPAKEPQHPVKPFELVQKLGDLSQITITEEVSKLLSTIRQSSSPSGKESGAGKPKDPRQAASTLTHGLDEQTKQSRADPRKARLGSNEDRPKEKLSIYEQGSIVSTGDTTGNKDVDLRVDDKDMDLRTNFGDLDLRSSRPDIDLRQLGLPFKAMQNYTPATEIDASVSSHPPISWTVHVVDVPKPDYTGLKLSVQEAHSTGDPRLRKIFRLDLDEKDSPASPKESPRAGPTTRADPRIRKADETKSEQSVVMSYAQQMSVLQNSAFYQNLTSNQKVKLNQELSVRDPSTGGNNEQILNGILSTLGLIQARVGTANINGAVLNLLSTITNISQMGGLQPQNPALLMGQGMMNQNPGIIQNPNMMPNPNIIPNPNMMPSQQVNPNILSQNQNMGLLGQGPGMHNDFQINFDPRNGGLLGNAPPFANFNQDNQNFNFAEDNFYPENNNFSNNNNNNRENRGFNREGRGSRRGRNFARNNRNNFRNRNRSNRGHNSG